MVSEPRKLSRNIHREFKDGKVIRWVFFRDWSVVERLQILLACVMFTTCFSCFSFVATGNDSPDSGLVFKWSAIVLGILAPFMAAGLSFHGVVDVQSRSSHHRLSLFRVTMLKYWKKTDLRPDRLSLIYLHHVRSTTGRFHIVITTEGKKHPDSIGYFPLEIKTEARRALKWLKEDIKNAQEAPQ